MRLKTILGVLWMACTAGAGVIAGLALGIHSWGLVLAAAIGALIGSGGLGIARMTRR